MANRRVPSADAQTAVLVASRRRCALCFGLRGDLSEKQGQLAHVDRDPSNSAVENLAFLCLPHHDAYDTRNSQSKGLTPGELAHYRDKLYAFLGDSPNNLNAYYAPAIGRPVETAPFFTLTSASVSANIMDFGVRNDAAPVTCLSFESRTSDVKVSHWYPSSLAKGDTLCAKIELASGSAAECILVMRVRDRGGLERTYELRLDRRNSPPRFDFVEVA